MKLIPSRLKRVKRQAQTRLLSLPGVVGVDIGYKVRKGKKTQDLAIRVLVKEKKKNVPQKERIPVKIDGFLTDVLERNFKPHGDMAKYVPLKGGASIGLCRLPLVGGTLGCIVLDNNTGALMALSTWHVLVADSDSEPEDTVVQPAISDSGVCPTDVIGTLVRGVLNTSVDCALASVDESNASFAVLNVGTIAGQSLASLGDVVKKRGSVSGLTYGIVDSVDLTIIVDYGGVTGEVTFTGQIGIEPQNADIHFGQTGDSGAVVLDTTRHVVGLYFAGSDDGYGAANPIAAVLSALDVSITTGEGGGAWVAWPEGLPTPLIMRRHSVDPRNSPVIMESRRKRVCRIHTGALELLQVQWNFTEDEYAAFKVFFDEELNRGVYTFQMQTLEITSAGTVIEVTRLLAFVDGKYSFNRSDNLFSVSATLEVDEEDVYDVPTSADLDLDQNLGDIVRWTATAAQIESATLYDEALGAILAGTATAEQIAFASAADLGLGQILTPA